MAQQFIGRTLKTIVELVDRKQTKLKEKAQEVLGTHALFYNFVVSWVCLGCAAVAWGRPSPACRCCRPPCLTPRLALRVLQWSDVATSKILLRIVYLFHGTG